MLVDISLTFFRNFHEKNFKFEDGLNFIIGPNGSGKTNILEAIGYLSQAKSFRKVADKDVISLGEKFFRIEGNIFRDELRHEIEVIYEQELGLKKIYLNKKQMERSSRLFSFLPSLISTDRDQEIIDGPPSERRNMINRLISIASPSYMNLLIDYKKVIENKNFLLREKKVAELGPWNGKQEELTKQIVRERASFIEKINIPYKNISKEFLNGKTSVVTYIPSMDGDMHLYRFIDEEMEIGYSIYGPHRDYFEFMIDDRPAKIFGSEGEKRLSILAFFFTFLTVYKPDSIVVLDEPFGVIDKRGMNVVLSYLIKNQTFISAPFLDNDFRTSYNVITL
ncbi:MAG TPA: DNA replication and repair protein RecF [Candidatus Hydrothermia bacterium]|nr:DNA replication and repair protein RecF [Candidatus Hydrothermia bacterium]